MGMHIMPKVRKYDIIFGHRAVWVNDAIGCLGRFGVRGIDIHRTIQEQLDGLPQCLHCTHEMTDLADWDTFKVKMMEFHQVDLEGSPVPQWLQVNA